MSDKVIMRMRRAHGVYNKGEIAGFDPVTATNYEAHGIAARYKPEAQGQSSEPSGQGTGRDDDAPTFTEMTKPATHVATGGGEKAAGDAKAADGAKPAGGNPGPSLPAQGKKS